MYSADFPSSLKTSYQKILKVKEPGNFEESGQQDLANLFIHSIKTKHAKNNTL